MIRSNCCCRIGIKELSPELELPQTSRNEVPEPQQQQLVFNPPLVDVPNIGMRQFLYECVGLLLREETCIGSDKNQYRVEMLCNVPLFNAYFKKIWSYITTVVVKEKQMSDFSISR